MDFFSNKNFIKKYELEARRERNKLKFTNLPAYSKRLIKTQKKNANLNKTFHFSQNVNGKIDVLFFALVFLCIHTRLDYSFITKQQY